MPTNLALLTYKATGSSTARSLGARAADVFNVKDYGALGNGSADDTAAIQAAVDAAQAEGGEIFFPVGNYKVTSTITTPPGSTFVNFRGAEASVVGGSGSLISGSVNGFLLQKHDNTDGYGLHDLSNISFTNVFSDITNAAGGGCVQLSGTICGQIENCRFNVPSSTTNLSFGILANGPPNNLARGDVNNLTIRGCHFNGNGKTSGSVGIQGGQITVQDCSLANLSVGIQQDSQSLVVFGCRIEVSHRAFYLGVVADGSSTSASVMIFGNSTESCDFVIDAPSNVSGCISNVRGQHLAGGGTTGINLGSANNLVMTNVEISGSYTKGFVISNSGGGTRLINCSANSISGTSPVPWTFPVNSRNGIRLVECDVSLPITFTELPGEAGDTGGIQTPLEGMTYDITDDNSAHSFLATASGVGSGSSAHRRVRYNASAAVWQVIG